MNLRALGAAALAALLGGPASAQDVTPPQFLSGPTFSANPLPYVPHSAIVDLVTDEPVQVILGFNDGFRSWRVIAEDQFGTVHSVPVLGMRPNRSHTIQVSVRDAAGNRTLDPTLFNFVTPPLPADFPPLVATVHDPSHLEPGVTLFAARYDIPTGGPGGSWIIVLDSEGEVVWYYRNPSLNPSNVERARNGRLLFAAEGGAWEMDMLGNQLANWYPSALGSGGAPPGAVLVPTDSFHHELTELPLGQEGDFLTLSSELRMLPDYPASETDPTITNPVGRVVGDVVVEFKRDGTIVREARLLDILDPYRVVYDSVNFAFWNATYGAPTHDWTHGNSVMVDTSDDTWIVSCRHQDAVVKIRRSTGELVWILGPHERWNPPWTDYLLTPVGGPFEWQYHQHAATINSFGNLVLFDNGNRRVIPPTPAPPPQQWYSRAAEFRIDAVARTVRQLWAYGGLFDIPQNQFFSAFLSEADPLPGSNVLVTDGGKPNFANGRNYARIAEVTRTRPAVPLSEVVIQDPAGFVSWTVFRSERLPSVYP